MEEGIGECEGVSVEKWGEGIGKCVGRWNV